MTGKKDYIDQIIDDLVVTIQVQRSDVQNTARWPDTTFWDVTLKSENGSELIFDQYGMGPAYAGNPPDAYTVLETFIDDAISDVVKPRGVANLRDFIGDDRFNALLGGDFDLAENQSNPTPRF